MSPTSLDTDAPPDTPLAIAPETVVVLDLEAERLDDVMAYVSGEIEVRFGLTPQQRAVVRDILARHGDAGIEALDHGVAVVHDQLRGVAVPPVAALVRTKQPIALGHSDSPPVQFIWVLLSQKTTHPHVSVAAEFAQLMRRESFRERMREVESRSELEAAYAQALREDLAFVHIPEELEATGRLFGGAMRDLRRRLPHYASDWRDGLNIKVAASVLFMFFACLAPAVAFGGLLSTLTGGHIGAIETVLASVVCGICWSLFAGQPLAIVGATGPNVIFTGILYGLCVTYDVPFLPTVAWTGLWAGLFMVILAAVDASALIRYFTRFSDEIFAALIALIFISEAIKDLLRVSNTAGHGSNTFLLTLLLALGTFGLARTMSSIRRSPYLRQNVRDFLSDFGPAIALLAMSYVGWNMHMVDLDTLAVPDQFAPTDDRSWLVSPFSAPVWVIAATPIPALLLTILIWTNQNITARLVSSADHQLVKGPAYHWDIALMGVLVAVMGLFGLPWVVGAVVRSLNHVKSLTVERHGKVVGVVENRLSNLAVHVLLGIALVLFLPWLGKVPMAVLFGMFMFMGVGTLTGNQFMMRLRLWVLDPDRYPTVHYLRAVPTRVVHIFTAVQLACLAILWFVKASPIGILFPFFLALLVPIRILLTRVLKPEHMALLDAEEVPAEEEYRDFGV